MNKMRDMTDDESMAMDGRPEDFPDRQEAMIEYRALWLAFLGGESEPFIADLRSRYPTEIACRRMDVLQTLISRGPGRVWREFAATLPGFDEWWGNSTKEIVSKFESKLPPIS